MTITSAETRPWAAYVLGCATAELPLWVRVFWRMPGPEWEAFDGVPLSLEDIRRALIVLAHDIPAVTLQEIRETMSRISQLHERMVRSIEGDETSDGFAFGSSNIPGEEDRKDLQFLADQALLEGASLHVIYCLGRAIGHYICELHESLELLSLEDVVAAAKAFNAQGVAVIPELEQLVEIASSEENALTALETVLNTRPDEPRLTGSCENIYADRLVRRLDASIRERLQVRSLAHESVQTASGAVDRGSVGSDDLAARLFVPTPLQKNILEALDGKALKKDSLAAEVCGGEGSRLYREGGIKELRAAGLVKHKHALGYYRPDKPPPGAVPLP